MGRKAYRYPQLVTESNILITQMLWQIGKLYGFYLPQAKVYKDFFKVAYEEAVHFKYTNKPTNFEQIPLLLERVTQNNVKSLSPPIWELNSRVCRYKPPSFRFRFMLKQEPRVNSR